MNNNNVSAASKETIGSYSLIKDKGFEKISENGLVKILVQFIVPIFFGYIIYTNRSNKKIYSDVIKFLLVIVVLSFLYKYIKQEPHPTDPTKKNSQISITYAFVILCILIAKDNGVFLFGNVKLFNSQFDYGNLLTTSIILVYGLGLVVGRLHYTGDVINTFLLTYLLYYSNIFSSPNYTPSPSPSPYNEIVTQQPYNEIITQQPYKETVESIVKPPSVSVSV
jgi:hypothetical protein